MASMASKDKKMIAQDLIMEHLSNIGYGSAYEDFVEKIGSQEEADEVMMKQMNRIAKIFGFNKAWFS
jgi:hypothetical protein